MNELRLSRERAAWLSRHILPHEPALYRTLARWRLPEGLEAEDVVQEAYCKLAAMDNFAAIQNPRAYLFSTARSIVLMYLRRSQVVSIKAVEDFEQLVVAADDPSPEDIASDREQLYILGQSVDRLPSEQRQPFLLRVMEELSHRDIAKRLGISENAVQKRIAKSLVALMIVLDRGGNDERRASSKDNEKERVDRK